MSQDRHDEILRRLAARQQQKHTQRIQDELGHVLDALNVWACLEDLREQCPPTRRAYAPRVFKSADILRCVLWHHAHSLFSPAPLVLVGVWVQAEGDAARVSVGQKTLIYAPATYNPESYHKLLRETYTLYYTDDGRPPSDTWLQVHYAPAEQLAQRRAIAQTLSAHSY